MYDKSSKQLSEDLYKSTLMEISREKQIIRSATIEMLDYCNYRCNHCYVRDSYKKVIQKEDFCWLIDELKNEGCVWLLLTGGEILMHPDFEELYLYAYNQGFIITLFSNGYYINEKIVKLFSAFPPQEIEITLYGGNEFLYDEYVGVEKAFKKVDLNIKKIIELNIPIKLKTVLTTDIYESYDKILNYAKKTGLELRIDGHILPKINGDNVEKLRLPAELMFMEDCQQTPSMLESAALKMQKYENSELLYSCAAGENSIFIDADMNACLCLMARHIKCKLIRNVVGLKVAQKNILAIKKHKKKLSYKDKCFECKYKVVCRYCPGQFLLENANEYVPIEWYCEYAKQFYDRVKGNKKC